MKKFCKAKQQYFQQEIEKSKVQFQERVCKDVEQDIRITTMKLNEELKCDRLCDETQSHSVKYNGFYPTFDPEWFSTHKNCSDIKHEVNLLNGQLNDLYSTQKKWNCPNQSLGFK